jgi:hypothetical protein
MSTKTTTSICAVALALLVLAAGPASAGGALAKSRFDVGREKWRTQFASSPIQEAWWADDGDFIYIIEDVSAGGTYETYFQAPPKFLGDKRSAYKGALEFDIGWLLDPPAALEGAAGVIYMHGNGVVLRFRFGPVDAGVFTKHVVPLMKEGWEQTSDNHQVTGRELKAVLGHLTAINVLLELDLPDKGSFFSSLDNVKLKTP